MKKEVNSRKYSKLAITSFIVSIFVFLWFVYYLFIKFYIPIDMPEFICEYPLVVWVGIGLFVISLINACISIYGIISINNQNNNLIGKKLVITALIISIISALFFSLYLQIWLDKSPWLYCRPEWASYKI